MTFYYYLRKQSKHRQELVVISSGRSTALDHLEQDHYMDRATEEYLGIFDNKDVGEVEG